MKRALILLLLASATLFAAVDGHWNGEFQAGKNKKKAATTTAVTLELHEAKGSLSGSVTHFGGKKARPVTIENGKIDGTHFTFTTTTRTKKATQVYQWEGTLQDDQITGTRKRDGMTRGQRFVAKRQG